MERDETLFGEYEKPPLKTLMIFFTLSPPPLIIGLFYRHISSLYAGL